MVFRICDQGIGIPLRDQPLLFDAFFRASNVGAIRGTGLGLKVVTDCVAVLAARFTWTVRRGAAQPSPYTCRASPAKQCADKVGCLVLPVHTRTN
ncbi:MAG: sensor histidine kinase [Chloroflexi bacterium]|nr:sensor histidine kinase [Chloroflexota bacterium]